jgi:hypothetical protein
VSVLPKIQGVKQNISKPLTTTPTPKCEYKAAIPTCNIQEVQPLTPENRENARQNYSSKTILDHNLQKIHIMKMKNGMILLMAAVFSSLVNGQRKEVGKTK